MKKIVFLFLLLSVFSYAFGEWSAVPDEQLMVSLPDYNSHWPKISLNNDGTYYVGYFTQNNVSGMYNLYVMHLDAEGNKLSEQNGMSVNMSETIDSPAEWDMVSDSANNVICAFSDNRSGESDIYVYKLSSTGNHLWGYDGIRLSLSGDDVEPKLAELPDGGVIVAWTNDSNVAMQGLHHSGTTAFGSSPVVLSDPSGANSFSAPQIVPVENGNFILKYCIDNGGEWTLNRHIYAQKYDQYGTAIWEEPSVITNAGGISYNDKILSITTDNYYGIYIGWLDDRVGNERPRAYIQYVSASGAVQYENGLSLYSSSNFLSSDIHVTYDDINDEVYAAWTVRDAGNFYHFINGQKITNHEIQWVENGAALVSIYPLIRSCIGLFVVDGEVMVVYRNSPSGTNYFHILAMKSNSDATSLWDSPVAIKTTHSTVDHAQVVMNSNNDIVTAYESEYNFVCEFDKNSIYAQNMSWNGELGVIEVSNDVDNVPSMFAVYPNPYGVSAAKSNGVEISFFNPKDGEVKVDIYNIRGQLVKSIANNFMQKGNQNLKWDTSNNAGKPVAMGVYLVQMKQGTRAEMKKITILK